METLCWTTQLRCDNTGNITRRRQTSYCHGINFRTRLVSDMHLSPLHCRRSLISCMNMIKRVRGLGISSTWTSISTRHQGNPRQSSAALQDGTHGRQSAKTGGQISSAFQTYFLTSAIFPHHKLVIVLNGAGSAQDRPNLWKVSNIMNEASLIRLLRQGVIDSMLAYSERSNGTKRHHRIPRTG